MDRKAIQKNLILHSASAYKLTPSNTIQSIEYKMRSEQHTI